MKYLLICISIITCGATNGNLVNDHESRLIEMIGHKWRTVGVLLTADCDQISFPDFDIPQTIIDLSAAQSKTTTPTTPADAYVFKCQHLSQMTAAMERAVAGKLVNPDKTFIGLLQYWPADLASDLRPINRIDLIVIRRTLKLISAGQSVLNQVLQVQRFRSTSRLPLSTMIGYLSDGQLDETAIKIISDRSYSLDNQVIKVSAFSLPPSTMKCADNPGQLCGRDVNLIRTLGQHLNFRPQFQAPPFGQKWGDQLANGTWSGLIGQVGRGGTTLGVANMFMTKYYLEQVEASYPYDISCSTFMTPIPPALGQWRTLIRPFDLTMWMVNLFVLIAGGMLITLLSRLYSFLMMQNNGGSSSSSSSSSSNPFDSFAEGMFFNVQAITGVACTNDTSKWPIRLYNSFWWAFCFFITTVYRTYLTAILTSPIHVPPIDTIRQLADSNLNLYGFGALVNNIAAQSSDPDLIAIGRRMQIFPADKMTKEQLMSQMTNAFYENKNYLLYEADVMNYEATAAYVHVMGQCLRSFPVAIAVTPQSPIKHHLDGIIHHLNAGGIIQFWMRSTLFEHRTPDKSSSDKIAFSLTHLEGAFYLLFICYSANIIAFAAEILFARCFN